MVVFYHFATLGAIYRSSFVQNSFLFVDFFFVLSGFVIASSYGTKLANHFSVTKFMALRLGRIYPLHLMMLALFLAFEVLHVSGLFGQADRSLFGGPNTFSMFVANILLLQPFVGPDWLSWNGPSWSIAVEVWTYLLFAFVFRWARVALVPMVTSLAAGCCFYLYYITDRYIHVFHDGAYARCIYGFSLGVLCHHLFKSGKIPRLSFWTASTFEIAIAASVVIMVTIVGAGPLSLAVPPIFFLAVLIFSNEQGIVSVLLTRPAFMWLGTMSYSIYMIHVFVEFRILNVLSVVAPSRVAHDGGNQIGGSPLFGDFMSIAALVLTIACAWLSYQLIEKPARDWSRRKILGTSPPKTEQTAEPNAPAL